MRKAAGLLLAALALCGCAAARPSAQAARRAAVDYNRAFADARNEILLLNILRAEAHEPLQFSTISGVTGGMRASASGTVPFENIILGGVEAINPTVELGTRNPAVTIAPLDGKEFRQGMARPVSLELVDHLLGQGFSRRVVLNLALGGVVCRDSRGAEHVTINTGRDPDVVQQFVAIADKADGWDVDEQAGASVATFVLPAAQALEVMRGGAGDGRVIAAVRQSEAQKKAGLVEVELAARAEPLVRKLDLSPVCGDEQAAAKPASRLLLRSPEAMITYLGEVSGVAAARRCEAPAAERSGTVLFRIFANCAGRPRPQNAVVSTTYRGRDYFIVGSDAQHATGVTDDLTLRMLAVLSQLIALQTTEASLAASRPVIAIPQ